MDVYVLGAPVRMSGQWSRAAGGRSQTEEDPVADDDRTLADRVASLERRIDILERRSISRQALDEELRSLELRLAEVRELEEG